MAIDRHAGTNAILAGESRNPMTQDGRLFLRNNLSLTTATTSEETLLTLTIPRNVLSSDKKTLRIHAWILAAATANNKNLSVRLNSLTGSTLYSFVGTPNNVAALMELYLSRINASSWEAFGMISHSATSGRRNVGTEMLADGFSLVFTGTTPTAAGDFTLRMVLVDLLTEGSL